MSIKRSTPAAVTIAVVLVAYAYFGDGASFNYRRIPWDQSYYASLSEGFFRGHLYMAHQPDKGLLASGHPYDPKGREGIGYLWDASYLNGHYYLYFSPVPALIFYMPYRLLRGGYPPDALAAAVFSAWAFLAAVAFARRVLALTGRKLHVPLAIWILVIGFGNVAPFLLADIRVYEVTILAGAALTAMWAYTLVRYVEQPSTARAVWMTVWLALAIATRPNLGVLLLVTAFVILSGEDGEGSPNVWQRLRRSFPFAALRVRMTAAAIPLAIAAIALMAYNYARFAKPFEFGHTYQLTFVDMQGRRVCSLCTLPEGSRFLNSALHYLFWPPVIRAEFPFVNLQYASPDPNTSFPMPGSEQVVGIIPLVPLVGIGTLFAAVFALRREAVDAGTRLGLQMMAGAWLVLIGVSTCWWIVSRYSMDFMILMTVASVICVEAGLTLLASLGVRLLPLRIAIVILVVYSSLIGFLLGFMGQNSTFITKHPALMEKLIARFK